MKLIDLEQNTSEWKAWRTRHLGASDASLIGAFFMPEVCEWPYSTSWPGSDIYKLWREKTGRTAIKEDKDQSSGDYVDPKAHGHKNEQAALEWYMGQTGRLCVPACVEHTAIPFVAASLDGIADDRKRIVEIKNPKEPETFEIVKAGRVPPQYVAQVQHQLFASEDVEICDFVAYFRKEGAIVEVARNERFIAALLNAETEFWSWVEAGKFPLPAGEMERDDEDWRSVVDGFLTAQAQVRFGEGNLRRAKVKLMRMMSAKKVTGAGVRVSLGIRPGYQEKKPRVVEERLDLSINHLL